jgi:hypothetical protein
MQSKRFFFRALNHLKMAPSSHLSLTARGHGRSIISRS